MSDVRRGSGRVSCIGVGETESGFWPAPMKSNDGVGARFILLAGSHDRARMGLKMGKACGSTGNGGAILSGDGRLGIAYCAALILMARCMLRITKCGMTDDEKKGEDEEEEKEKRGKDTQERMSVLRDGLCAAVPKE